MVTLGEWTSPFSDVTYPSGWQVSFQNHDLALTIKPLIKDQEMTVSYVYWEGAVEVEGEMMDEDVTRRGNVELTGYGSAQASE